MVKLNREFYACDDTVATAKSLIGKLIVRKCGQSVVTARITEAEAYVGAVDKACHCYNGRMTERTKVMFGPPGHAYVYFIYGMYFCFNIVTEPEGKGSAVLIRACEPVSGHEDMAMNRYGLKYNMLNSYKLKNMLNGPGKLCRALNITKADNGVDLMGDDFYIADDGYSGFRVDATVRVNIDYAEEAKDFLWRFVMSGGGSHGLI